MDIFEVELSKGAKKNLRKAPKYIVTNLLSWVRVVEEFGVKYTRLLPGYHDELLKGNRKGQRSIRLSKSYRAIYVEKGEKQVIIEVLEVNKHEY